MAKEDDSHGSTGPPRLPRPQAKSGGPGSAPPTVEKTLRQIICGAVSLRHLSQGKRKRPGSRPRGEIQTERLVFDEQAQSVLESVSVVRRDINGGVSPDLMQAVDVSER